MRTIGVRDHVRGKCFLLRTAAFAFTRHAPGSSLTILKVTLSTGDIPSAPASLHWKRGAVVFTFVSIMSSMESVILTQVCVLMNSSVNANAAV